MTMGTNYDCSEQLMDYALGIPSSSIDLSTMQHGNPRMEIDFVCFSQQWRSTSVSSLSLELTVDPITMCRLRLE